MPSPELSVWLSRDALSSCFYSSRSFLDFSGSWCTSSRLFALRPGSFWTCMYLIRFVFWSIQVLFCLDFCSQLIWVVFLQSGFSLILSWSLPHHVGVLFWSIRVLSDLVLVLAAPCQGSFFINPGSFWSCLGSCRILSGFFFDQSGFFLKLSCYLQHLFRVVFWLFRVLSELVRSSSGLFSDQSKFFF